MLVEDFINNVPDWERILSSDPYYITVKRDGEYFLLKYSQIDSDFSNEIVQQARGSIFKMINGKAVCVCRPFRKFHNIQEPNAAEIDWDTAYVQEKVDGSLMKLWWDDGWHLSTNNTIDAFKAIVLDGSLTFGDIFLRAVGHKTLEGFAAHYDKSRTYCFELTSPETQVVIPYDDGAYFLTSFETATGIEYPATLSVKCPKLYDFKSKEDILAVVEEMSKDEEGFVVCDAQGNRVKVKSKGWLMAHYTLRNNVITYKYLFKLAKDELLDDFLAVGARYADKVQEVKDFLSLIKEECEIGWSLVSHLVDEPQKVFAQAALKTAQPHYCFAKQKNRDLTPQSYVQNLTIQYLTKAFHNKVPS